MKEAGWDKNYHCSVSGIINPFEDSTIMNKVGVKAIKFLENFGGLHIGKTPQEKLNTLLPVELLKNPEVEDYSHFAEQLGYNTPLYACIIGFSTHIELFMTVDGHIYGHFDDPLWKFGTSGEDALENLCNDKILKTYQ